MSEEYWRLPYGIQKPQAPIFPLKLLSILYFSVTFNDAHPTNFYSLIYVIIIMRKLILWFASFAKTVSLYSLSTKVTRKCLSFECKSIQNKKKNNYSLLIYMYLVQVVRKFENFIFTRVNNENRGTYSFFRFIRIFNVNRFKTKLPSFCFQLIRFSSLRVLGRT